MKARMFVKGDELYTLTPYNRQFINELRNIESRRWKEPYNTIKITKDKRDAIRVVHLMNRYFGVQEINIPDIAFGHASYLKGSKFSESILFKTEYSEAFKNDAKSMKGKWNDVAIGWELSINSIPAIDKVRMLVTKYDIEYERGTESIINDRYSRLIEAHNKKQALVEMSKRADMVGVSNIDTPDGINLYPFQQVGVNYIKQNPGNVLIADSTGLGKTAQALTYCYNIKKYPVLIVVPASVKINWSREIKKFCANDSIVILSGRSSKQIPKADFVVINYDIVSDWKARLVKYGFKILIMDEAQYIKNPKSKRSAACFDISKCNTLEKTIAISATPMMSRPVELLPVLRVLDVKHEDLESDFIFKSKYCVDTSGYRPSYNGATNLDELNVLLRETCMIRRLMDDVMPELPDKVRIPVALEIKNRREYRLAESRFATWYKNEYHSSFEGKSNALTKIAYLRQLAAKGKLNSTIEYIENILESTDKIVIFAHHRNIQEEIFNHFSEKYPTVKITGGMSAEEKLKNEDEFQRGDARIIVCSLQACKAGINLQAANTLIFLELSYVPSDITQSEGRIRRIGSTGDTCFYHYLVAESTIEEHILNIISSKQSIIDQAIDGLSGESDNNIFDELLAVFE